MVERLRSASLDPTLSATSITVYMVRRLVVTVTRLKRGTGGHRWGSRRIVDWRHSRHSGASPHRWRIRAESRTGALSVGSLVGLATLSTAIWRFLPARIVGSVGGTLGSMGGYWVLVETGDGTGQAGFALVVVLCSLLLFSASGLLDQLVNAPGR